MGLHPFELPDFFFPPRIQIKNLMLLVAFLSADLEITVHLLVQVDKLVQLIESPVFTCKSLIPLFLPFSYLSRLPLDDWPGPP